MTAIAWAALGIAALAVSGLVGFGVAALAARKEAGREKARGDALTVRLEVMTKQRDDAVTRADHEKERADALDDLFASYAVTGPVDGEYERLLQEWRARRAASGDSARALPPAAATADPGPDDLLRPGE